MHKRVCHTTASECNQIVMWPNFRIRNIGGLLACVIVSLRIRTFLRLFSFSFLLNIFIIFLSQVALASQLCSALLCLLLVRLCRYPLIIGFKLKPVWRNEFIQSPSCSAAAFIVSHHKQINRQMSHWLKLNCKASESVKTQKFFFSNSKKTSKQII